MSADSTTASAQRRRVTKPLMERRRRARINSCLAQLKDMVVVESTTTAADSFESRTCRLEKADILEMTVQHVKKLNNFLGSKSRYNAPFEDGYRRCISEVARYMTERNKKIVDDSDKMWKSLLRHLQQSLPSQVVECPYLPRVKPNIIAVSCHLKEVRLTSDEDHLVPHFPTREATVVSSQSDDNITRLISSDFKDRKIHLQIKPLTSSKFDQSMQNNKSPRWRVEDKRSSSQSEIDLMWRPW